MSRWQIVVTTERDVTQQLTVRGPETRATVTPIPADAEFFGVVFSLAMFTPAVPLARQVESTWGNVPEVPVEGSSDAAVVSLRAQLAA